MQLSPATFAGLCQTIHQLCGIVIAPDKEYLIHHRLEPVVRQHCLKGFDELRDRLRDKYLPGLVESVIDAVTTQETSFFRDPGVFEGLGRTILPDLGRSLPSPAASLRIWSAGCSTGQEAYSLAILATEYAERSRAAGAVPAHVAILATDTSRAAIETARQGIYSSRETARGLDAARRQRFFEPKETGLQVKAEVRKLVEFRLDNLVQPQAAPKGPFHLICCRNVLIYFDQETRTQICGRFYEQLVAGGYLLLGSAENLYGISNAFESLPLGESLIYRRGRESSAGSPK